MVGTVVVVLVVDQDQRGVRRAVSALDLAGCRCVPAQTIDQGLTALSMGRFDGVVVRHRPPTMDAAPLIRAASRRGVGALVALVDSLDVFRADRLGSAGAVPVVDPFTGTHLAAVVRDTLGRQAA